MSPYGVFALLLSRESWLAGSFAGGVIGNWTASFLQSVARETVKPLLDRIAEELAAGGLGGNHDLLRALRRAECAAFISLCDETLGDYGIRRKGPQLLDPLLPLWERDHAARALLRHRHAAARTYAHLAKTPVSELQALDGAALHKAPAFLKAAREALEPDVCAETPARVLENEIRAIEELFAPDPPPPGLLERARKSPGGFLDRVGLALREELKRTPAARVAFELDVLSKLDGYTPPSFEEFEKRLAEALEARLGDMARTLEKNWDELAALRLALDSAVDALFAQLDRIEGGVTRIEGGVERIIDLVGRPGAPWRLRVEVPPRALAGRLFGRAILLSQLVERLRARQDTDVWGPPGMGKTALAAEAVLEMLGQDHWVPPPQYPDGIVFLDLYASKGDATTAWNRLASAFAPDLPTDMPPGERARKACDGRRALVIVEGAEQAGTGAALRSILAVLSPGTVRLVLTRNRDQVSTSKPLSVEAELTELASLQLLEEIAGDLRTETAADRPDGRDLFPRVLKRLGGHPLALTWAAHQMVHGSEDPIDFVQALERENLPRLHEPADEVRTLRWLYDRSARLLGEGPLLVLAGAALLALEPVPLSAATACLARGANPREVDVKAALRDLVKHGLMRRGEGGTWVFTHAFAHQFARSGSPTDPDLLDRLGSWAVEEIGRAIEAARTGSSYGALERVLRHAGALLRDADPGNRLERLSEHLLYTARDALVNLGRLDHLEAALRPVAERLGSRSRAAPASNSLMREHSVALNLIGDVRIAQGRLDDALAAFEESLCIGRALAEADPGNAGWQRDLSVSLDRVGNVRVAQGRLDDALAAFEESLRIARALAEADPGNAGWRRDLSVSFVKIGDVRVAQGRLDDALAAYEASLRMQRALAEADPGNAGWQRNLSASLERMGHVRVAQGRLDDPLAAFEESLRIARTLAEADPGNAGSQSDLSASFVMIGDVRVAQGRLDDALAAFEESLCMRRALAETDPGNAGWRRGLSVSLDRVGNIRVDQGRLDDALAAFEESLRIGRALAEADPGNAGWQRDLSVSLRKVGDVCFEQGRLDDALAAFEESLRIDRALAKADPGNAGWQRDLFISLTWMMLAHEERGDADSARPFANQALRIIERLAASDPTNTIWQRDLAWTRATALRLGIP